MDNSSILESVKQALGIVPDYDVFDPTLIMHINSVFAILHQIGVGKTKFKISDSAATWDDYLATEDDIDVEEVKSYMVMKVQMMWDTSTMSGTTANAYKEQTQEMEWRLNVEADDYEHLGEQEITWQKELERKRKAKLWPEAEEEQ